MNHQFLNKKFLTTKLLILLSGFLICCSSVWAHVDNLDKASTSSPDLPEPIQTVTSILPTKNGSLRFKSALDGTVFSIVQDFNSEEGAPLVLDLATQRIPKTTLGWLVSAKQNQIETVMNMGWRFGLNQQLLFSAAQLRELVDSDNVSNLSLHQLSGGLNYRYFLDKKWLSGIEVSAYASSSPSQLLPALGDASDASQRSVGSNLYGVRFGVETSPLPDAKLHIGLGSERLSYDNLSSEPIQYSVTSNINWNQILLPTLRYNASLKTNGMERYVSTGLDFNWRDGHQLGIKLARTQWLHKVEGPATENAIKLAYTYHFGNKFAPFQSQKGKAPWSASLIPEVLERPGYLPDSVLVKSEARE